MNKVIVLLRKNIDKVAHESLSNVIAWGVFLSLFYWLHFYAIVPAIIISFIVGFIKEKKDSKFDIQDIYANTLGVISAILTILYLVNYVLIQQIIKQLI